MNKWLFFTLFFSVLLISACSNSDELSGHTFNVSHTPPFQEDIDDPDKYHSIMTLEFSDGKVSSANSGEGTYELKDDVLLLNFENENEQLEIEFTEFKESDKDFSEYSTLISRSELNITDPDKVSHFGSLHSSLTNDMLVEFLQK
ncbi:hypothetical protein [Bacillus suaedae]|uniref:Lipoprotein n=1 Tax=Halalkalibacter suaedae TaxID=2822140 RepID=A0A940WS51_9BACI|nr:hypothetical protein [Bacillus suaedae]MBP3951709.1 hypothetical protein [Bacillus suaedae]